MRRIRVAALVIALASLAACDRTSRDASGTGSHALTNPDVVPPSATLEIPTPTPVFAFLFPPGTTIRWSGEDSDGHIVHYRHRLFTTTNPDFPHITDFIAFARATPDSVLHYYSPDFNGWDTAKPHETELTFQGLDLHQPYLFAVVAVDDDGQSDVALSFSSNLLHFYAGAPGSGGPLLAFFNDTFSYRFVVSRYSTDPAHYAHVELAPGTSLTMNWSAIPLDGGEMQGFCWGLDLVDVEARAGWSGQGLENTSATVGPFGPGETHLLYVEAEDDLGRLSLSILQIAVSAAP